MARRRNRHWNRDSLKLKAWIVVPTSLAALAGLAIFGTHQYRGYMEESKRNMLIFTEQTRAKCYRYMNSKIQLLKTQIDHVAQNPEILKAWQDRNPEALKALTRSNYEDLKTKYKITHFYFIEPDRTCFLRVHQPARCGDLLNRTTLLMASRTGEDVWGTELGSPNGTFTLRYVKPWKQNGKIIGYPSQEALGRNLHEILVLPEYRPARDAAFQEYLRRKKGLPWAKLWNSRHAEKTTRRLPSPSRFPL